MAGAVHPAASKSSGFRLLARYSPLTKALILCSSSETVIGG